MRHELKRDLLVPLQHKSSLKDFTAPKFNKKTTIISR